MAKVIPNFYPNSGYYFLSNFFESPFDFMGVTYLSNEHFYQAAKAITPEAAAEVADCKTAGETKKRGKKIACRTDWDDIKISVMRLGLKLKFNSHPELMQKLLDTGDAILEEQNYWGDLFWGKDEKTGEGHNVLGRLLMELRDSVKK